MASKTLELFGLELTFVFRHKWDEASKRDFYRGCFRQYELGLFFEKNIILSKMRRKPNPNSAKKFDMEYVDSYMFGINLLVVKLWLVAHKCTELKIKK